MLNNIEQNKETITKRFTNYAAFPNNQSWLSYLLRRIADDLGMEESVVFLCCVRVVRLLVYMSPHVGRNLIYVNYNRKVYVYQLIFMNI